VDTKQRSATAKDPSSEGMFLRARRGVPDGEEKRCEEAKKDEETCGWRIVISPIFPQDPVAGEWLFRPFSLTIPNSM